VKPFSLLKIPVLLAGFGALLFFAPACKAQSEISPDHFDGTDAWEIAAHKPVVRKAMVAPERASYQAQNKKADSAASLKLAAVREASDASHDNAVAIPDKRKVATVRKPDQK
jgi:hypothetical protein